MDSHLNGPKPSFRCRSQTCVWIQIREEILQGQASTFPPSIEQLLHDILNGPLADRQLVNSSKGGLKESGDIRLPYTSPMVGGARRISSCGRKATSVLGPFIEPSEKIRGKSCDLTFPFSCFFNLHNTLMPILYNISTRFVNR